MGLPAGHDAREARIRELGPAPSPSAVRVAAAPPKHQAWAAYNTYISGTHCLAPYANHLQAQTGQRQQSAPAAVT